MEKDKPDSRSPSAYELTEAEAPLIRARTMEILLSAGYFPSVTHMLVVLIVAYVMTPANSLFQTVPWATAFFVILSIQGWFARKFGNRRLLIEEAVWLNARFNLTQMGIGILWGTCGALFFPPDDFGRALFLVFVMGGMAMSAVATQHANLRFCILQIVLGIGPLAINYTLSDLPFGQLSGFFLFLYLAVLSSLAVRQYRFARKTIDLQIVQERLLDRLSAQTEELKMARNTADEANASKSRFLAQASHDLRQPLHAISLFVESLPSLKDKQQHEQVLGKIRQSLDILTKLFDSLLDVTMLDTGGIQVRKSAFILQDEINQVIQDFELVAEANDVVLKTVPTALVVDSDPVLLRRLLQNLLSNALRHAPGQTTLVGCRRRQDKVSLIVADNGPGISPNDQDRIFTEFERLEGARMGEAATPGLGLGLSIVRRITIEMGLEIKLFSNPGRLTVFEISGVDVGSRTQVKAQKTNPVTGNILDKLSVYVLDDNLETLEATQLLLERWGCRVAIAQHPDEMKTDAPDLLICDYEISTDVNGLDIIDALPQRYGHAVPAILISGHSSENLKEAALSRNIPLLHKPVRPAPLRSAMLNLAAKSGESLRSSE